MLFQDKKSKKSFTSYSFAVNEGGMNTDWARVAAAQALQGVHTTQPGANPSAPPAYDAVMTTAQPAKVDLSNID